MTLRERTGISEIEGWNILWGCFFTDTPTLGAMYNDYPSSIVLLLSPNLRLFKRVDRCLGLPRNKNTGSAIINAPLWHSAASLHTHCSLSQRLLVNRVCTHQPIRTNIASINVFSTHANCGRNSIALCTPARSITSYFNTVQMLSNRCTRQKTLPLLLDPNSHQLPPSLSCLWLVTKNIKWMFAKTDF